MSADQDGVFAYDPVLGEGRKPASGMRGKAYLFERIAEREEHLTRASDSWTRDLVTRFRGQIMALAAYAFLASLPGLLTPLFIMLLYDRVILGESVTLLLQLAGVMVVLILIDLVFRLLRARTMAYIATRIGRLVACGVLHRLMALPPQALERAKLRMQLRRIRQFEGARDYFSDPLINVAFNLPYSLLFIAVIALLAGEIVLLPMTVMLFYGLLSWLLLPRLARHNAASSEARQVRDACYEEMIAERRSLRLLSADAIWLDRFRNYSAGAALAGHRSARIQTLLQIVGQGAITFAGVGVLVLGAVDAMAGTMTVGALIASMALVWRVLGPWQQGIIQLPRIAQIRREMAALDQVMRLADEGEERRRRLMPRAIAGHIRLDNVSLNYEGGGRPALLGANLQVDAGEMIAVVGESGAGKSSLAKVVAGLYQPQMGAVRVDRIDLRQLNPREYRESIAYAPQYPRVFTGTIAQNLRLVAPDASDDDLRQAAAAAGVLVDIEALAQGFHTRIGDASVQQQPPGFVQRLSLARVYLRHCALVLLDEPGRALDNEGDRCLREQLQRLHGQCTIIVVTHRPSHLRLADKVYQVQAGRLTPVSADSLPAGRTGR
jgi:ATP-binding cassette subfamily C protein/ATP-binding cassette subfamily C protein LapB